MQETLAAIDQSKLPGSFKQHSTKDFSDRSVLTEGNPFFMEEMYQQSAGDFT